MKERILKILSGLRPEFDFTMDVNFIEEGILDSFDVINLVTAFLFGYVIASLPHSSSVNAIVMLLKKNGVKA